MKVYKCVMVGEFIDEVVNAIGKATSSDAIGWVQVEKHFMDNGLYPEQESCYLHYIDDPNDVIEDAINSILKSINEHHVLIIER